MTRLERLRDALAVATTRPPHATTSTPYRLENPLNGRGLGVSRGARMASAARRRRERAVGWLLARRCAPLPLDRLCVVLTRISPRPFDDDGTVGSLKSVRDGAAEAWGLDDGDPRVTWVCDWRKGEAHVVELAVWAVPLRVSYASPADSDGEVDPSDYERPQRVVVHGGLIQRREARVTPNVVRAKGGA